MKKLLLFLIFIVFLLSCKGPDGLDGQDGADGISSLSITWIFSPFAFYSNNPGLPDIGYNGTYYKSNAGEYYFEYIAWDDSYWNGYYKIIVNQGEAGEPGELGGLFGEPGADGEDGADGANIYFELSCLSVGPSLYAWDYPHNITKNESELNRIKKTDLPAERATKDSWMVNSDIFSIPNECNSDYEEKIITRGRFTFIIRYHRIR